MVLPFHGAPCDVRAFQQNRIYLHGRQHDGNPAAEIRQRVRIGHGMDGAHLEVGRIRNPDALETSIAFQAAQRLYCIECAAFAFCRDVRAFGGDVDCVGFVFIVVSDDDAHGGVFFWRG